MSGATFLGNWMVDPIVNGLMSIGTGGGGDLVPSVSEAVTGAFQPGGLLRGGREIPKDWTPKAVEDSITGQRKMVWQTPDGQLKNFAPGDETEFRKRYGTMPPTSVELDTKEKRENNKTIEREVVDVLKRGVEREDRRWQAELGLQQEGLRLRRDEMGVLRQSKEGELALGHRELGIQERGQEYTHAYNSGMLGIQQTRAQTEQQGVANQFTIEQDRNKIAALSQADAARHNAAVLAETARVNDINAWQNAQELATGWNERQERQLAGAVALMAGGFGKLKF